jgi:hypothetical protein
MSIAVCEQEGRLVTTPYGRLVDQATLLGVLNGLQDSMHMLLLAVERLSIEAMEGPSIEAMEGPSIETTKGPSAEAMDGQATEAREGPSIASMDGP